MSGNDWRFAGNRGSMHQPAMAVIAALGRVLNTTVVPDDQHVGLPTMPIHEPILRCVLTQLLEQSRRLVGVQVGAFEADGPELVVIRLRKVPLSFAALSSSDRSLVESHLGTGAAARYEEAVAAFLDDVMDEVEKQYPPAVLSVLGLPVEPEEAGVSLATVQQTNERYHGVIDRLGPFVPTRRFVVMGSSLDEKRLARMGMREAIRLRDGRPIIFQSNHRWQALVDVNARQQDFQLEALLGDDP